MALFPLQLAGNSLLVEQSSYEGGKNYRLQDRDYTLDPTPWSSDQTQRKGTPAAVGGQRLWSVSENSVIEASTSTKGSGLH